MLSGFAVAQPLFDVLGDSPDFFLFRKASTAEIVALTAVVVAGPPLVLWAVGGVASLAGPRARRRVHLASLAVLLTVVAIEVLKEVTPLRGMALLGAGAALAAGGLALYARRAGVRLWFRYVSPAPLVFALLFLVFSPVSNLVLPGSRGVVALSTGEARAPVVFLLLDEFPLRTLLDAEGRIDGRVYPNFARLAGDATWYRNATAVVGFTPHAVPSLLTGRMPERSAAPAASQYPDNLFTLLGESHDLFVYESVTAMCPSDLCAATASFGRAGLPSLVADSADVWRRIVALHDVEEDPVGVFLRDETVGEARGGDEPEPGDLTFGFDALRANQPLRLTEFLDTIDGTGRPLHFLHLLLPHAPYRYLPSGQQYEARNFLKPGGDKTEEPWPWMNARQRLLLQTAYTDRLLGEVLDRLEASGLYDRALVVVTADHGLSLIPGDGQPSKSVTATNAHEVAWVPLLVKAPGQDGSEIDDGNAMLIDVVPTMAEILGIEVPWQVDGISLVSEERRTHEKLFVNSLGDGPVEIDGPTWFPRVLDGATDRLAEPEAGVAGLFRFGPHTELVGTRVAGHDVDLAAGRVRVDEADDYRSVDPDGATVPAIVSGEIDGVPGVGAGSAVAVAVNGVIGGVSEVFPAPDRDAGFVTMVSPTLFRAGENRVEVFVIAADEGRVRLERLDRQGRRS